MTWFYRIKNDISALPDMIDFFNKELIQAKAEAKIEGSVERSNQLLPGQVAYRFDQLQELEAVLKYLNITYDKMRSHHYRKYLERYQRELSDRSIEKYIDGENDIVDWSNLINEVALVRNKYLGIMKAFDAKSYSLGNITRLRVAGMNDAEV